jgi:hypothetical protein
LEDAFSESDMPFRVDVVDYRAVSDEFRAIIDARSGLVYGGGRGEIQKGGGGGLNGKRGHETIDGVLGKGNR